MNPDLEMAIPEPVPTAENPYARGWRYTGLDGEDDWRVPLTEDDLVFPQEGDFVVNNKAHHDDLAYLESVFTRRIADRPELRLLADHLIDFQHPQLKKWLGPDLILFNGEAKLWNPNRGVFPVKRMKARPLFAVEVTSPNTRRLDLTKKMGLFYLVGVPVYVIIDLPSGGAKRPMGIVAFQAGPTEYEQLPPERNGRVWLEVVEVFLAYEKKRVVCYDRHGTRIPDAVGLAAEVKVEKARADEATRKLAELEAELQRLRGNTDTPNS